MKLKIYSVYDSKVEAYLQPFFLRSRGEALRAFQEVCSDPKSKFFKHGGDYTLFEIGEYDEISGLIESFKAKVSLGTALEFQTKTPEVAV